MCENSSKKTDVPWRLFFFFFVVLFQLSLTGLKKIDVLQLKIFKLVLSTATTTDSVTPWRLHLAMVILTTWGITILSTKWALFKLTISISKSNRFQLSTATPIPAIAFWVGVIYAPITFLRYQPFTFGIKQNRTWKWNTFDKS